MAKNDHSTLPIRNMRRGAALLGLLVVGLGLAFSWHAWRDEQSKELRHLAALVEVGEQSLNSYFRQLETSLKLLSLDIVDERGRVDPARARLLQRRFRKEFPDVLDIGLNRVDGQMLASAESLPGEALPTLARLPSFVLSREELLQGQTLSIARPTISIRTREWIIPVRYGIRDAAGQLRYILSATLPLSRPHSFWKDAPLFEGEALGLVRDDGFLVSRYPVPPKMELDFVYGKPRTGGTLYEHIRTEYSERGQYPVRGVVEGEGTVSGDSRVFVYRRLTHYPITFFVTLPATVLRDAWWDRVRIPYLLFLLLALGGWLVYRWVLDRHTDWELQIGKLNEELKRRVGQLETANTELEAFSYSVSHDLRAPLRSIDGFSQVLLADASGRLDETSNGLLQRIRRASQHMSEQIDALLHLSRLGRTEIVTERVNLSAQAREILSGLREREPQREVSVEVQDGVEIDADPRMMRSLLENLLGNAWKFTAKKPQARIQFGAEKWDEGLVVFVKDNGAGFDMQYAQKLFGAFQRLHRTAEFEGTGIGLATVRRIVNLHGGRIWAKATPGAGAAFYFVLPGAVANKRAAAR